MSTLGPYKAVISWEYLLSQEDTLPRKNNVNWESPRKTGRFGTYCKSPGQRTPHSCFVGLDVPNVQWKPCHKTHNEIWWWCWKIQAIQLAFNKTNENLLESPHYTNLGSSPCCFIFPVVMTTVNHFWLCTLYCFYSWMHHESGFTWVDTAHWTVPPSSF